MHAHTLLVDIIHRTHAIFFFRSVSHEGTHQHTSPSPSYRAFFISHVHAQRSMFLYVCVYIARSFIVFHTNRSIDISSEVSPSFRMQSFSSGRSPMKAHTNTHPPLHHIEHSLSLTRACATIDVPLCVCVCSYVFHSFPHKPINLYI